MVDYAGDCCPALFEGKGNREAPTRKVVRPRESDKQKEDLDQSPSIYHAYKLSLSWLCGGMLNYGGEPKSYPGG